MNETASKSQTKTFDGARTFKVTVPFNSVTNAIDSLTIKTKKVVTKKADWIQVTDGGALIGWVEDYDTHSKIAWAYGVGAWLKVTRVQ